MNKEIPKDKYNPRHSLQNDPSTSEEYSNMPCPVCGKNMFNRWIRDVKARICHSCEDRIDQLKRDLKYLNRK